MCDCLSLHMYHSFHWLDFHEVWYWKLLNMNMWLKLGKNVGHFTWTPLNILHNCCTDMFWLQVLHCLHVTQGRVWGQETLTWTIFTNPVKCYKCQHRKQQNIVLYCWVKYCVCFQQYGYCSSIRKGTHCYI